MKRLESVFGTSITKYKASRSYEIENYMQKFEVLATDSFKKKEIREPKIEN